MNRLAFLKAGLFPVVAAGLAAAEQMNPYHEEEALDAMIVVNAPGVTIQNLNMVSKKSRPYAIKINEPKDAKVLESMVRQT